MLLNVASEEAFMSFYLGVNVRSGLFRSPLREDKNPTCSFYRNKRGSLIFKDFGSGFHGDFINVVEHKFNVNFAQALRIIANDFGIIKDKELPKNAPKLEYDGSVITQRSRSIIQCEIQDFTKKELKWWNSFGITEETLRYFNVFSIKNLFLNTNWNCSSTRSSPIYGYYFGKKDGLEIWKIYFPFRSKYRFMSNTDSNLLQGAKQLKFPDKIVTITKSLKDVMTLYELGINAVATQAESVVLTERQIEFMQNNFDFIVNNADWDNAGKTFLIKSKKLYDSIPLSFKNKQIYGKDISDFVKLYGKQTARQLIDQLKNDIYSGMLKENIRNNFYTSLLQA